MTAMFDEIKAELAANLTPAVGFQVETDLGYGRDLSCGLSDTPDLREVDPHTPEGIGQSLFRFLLSVRETIPDAPGRGLGVQGWVSAGVTYNQLRAYGGMVRGEADQDDRIDSAVCKVTIEGSRETPALRFETLITPKADLGLDEFKLIVTVPQSGEAFLEILRR